MPTRRTRGSLTNGQRASNAPFLRSRPALSGVCVPNIQRVRNSYHKKKQWWVKPYKQIQVISVSLEYLLESFVYTMDDLGKWMGAGNG